MIMNKKTTIERLWRSYLICFILFLSFTACSDDMGKESVNLKLWYDKPASIWEEALPLGNGRIGAMVFGDPLPSVDGFVYPYAADGGHEKYLQGSKSVRCDCNGKI